ncbi:uncharacterized protein EV422DRAFT_538944 [Fimicolochytrium jonesii]|uniref:uncharacterized protein n=1 Tax=Fimicolochytrium jonesii TaxID=1396493 RepID=UPI0022FF0223|nr:uncharacterized protein EV422DRAFT_538944 [Fimicolochytrium jonesii]KAI8818167.1 hypothetical protein EV422DRAFT_538944 [Fimicolochytrium jonesii]
MDLAAVWSGYPDWVTLTLTLTLPYQRCPPTWTRALCPDTLAGNARHRPPAYRESSGLCFDLCSKYLFLLLSHLTLPFLPLAGLLLCFLECFLARNSPLLFDALLVLPGSTLSSSRFLFHVCRARSASACWRPACSVCTQVHFTLPAQRSSSPQHSPTLTRRQIARKEPPRLPRHNGVFHHASNPRRPPRPSLIPASSSSIFGISPYEAVPSAALAMKLPPHDCRRCRYLSTELTACIYAVCCSRLVRSGSLRFHSLDSARYVAIS